jgi:hypothetical protein
MTTGKTYHAPHGGVTLGKPTIGPKVYLTRGPSGWPEQFPRRTADKALETFLAPLDLQDVLASFAAMMKLEARDETWEDVLAHLTKITGTAGKLIPNAVSVAFWGRYILALQNEGTN